MALEIISALAGLTTIIKNGIGVLTPGKADPKIERVITDRTDKENEWIVRVVRGFIFIYLSLG